MTPETSEQGRTKEPGAETPVEAAGTLAALEERALAKGDDRRVPEEAGGAAGESGGEARPEFELLAILQRQKGNRAEVEALKGPKSRRGHGPW